MNSSLSLPVDAALEMETFISYHLQSRPCRCILDSLRLVLSTSAKMVAVIYPLNGHPWHIVLYSVVGFIALPQGSHAACLSEGNYIFRPV